MKRKPTSLSKIAIANALDIMERLEKHPCAEIFKTTKRKKDITINVIKSKLRNSEYKTPKEWMRDVQSIYDQAETYSGKYSYVCCLANEFVRLFEKEVQPGYVSHSKTKWSQLLGELNHKLQTHFHKMPSNVSILNFVTATLSCSVPSETDVISIDNVQKSSVDNFMDSLSLLSSRADAREMAKIIMKHHPGLKLGPDCYEVDVEKLSSKAMNELIEYSMSRHEKLKKAYPGTE